MSSGELRFRDIIGVLFATGMIWWMTNKIGAEDALVVAFMILIFQFADICARLKRHGEILDHHTKQLSGNLDEDDEDDEDDVEFFRVT